MNRVEELDPYCPYKDAEIFEQYNTTLTDPRNPNKMSYHVLQVLKFNDNRYIVWNRAGTCPTNGNNGNNGNNSNDTLRTQIYQDIYDNPFDAVSKFLKIFKTKTSNEFNDPNYRQNRGYNKI